jgi:hypothetical protein
MLGPILPNIGQRVKCLEKTPENSCISSPATLRRRKRRSVRSCQASWQVAGEQDEERALAPAPRRPRAAGSDLPAPASPVQRIRVNLRPQALARKGLAAYGPPALRAGDSSAALRRCGEGRCHRGRRNGVRRHIASRRRAGLRFAQPPKPDGAVAVHSACGAERKFAQHRNGILPAFIGL